MKGKFVLSESLKEIRFRIGKKNNRIDERIVSYYITIE